MVALQRGRIERVPVAEAVGSLKMVEPDLLRLNAMFQPRIPGDEHPGLPADAPTARLHGTRTALGADVDHASLRAVTKLS